MGAAIMSCFMRTSFSAFWRVDFLPFRGGGRSSDFPYSLSGLIRESEASQVKGTSFGDLERFWEFIEERCAGQISLISCEDLLCGWNTLVLESLVHESLCPCLSWHVIWRLTNTHGRIWRFKKNQFEECRHPFGHGPFFRSTENRFSRLKR